MFIKGREKWEKAKEKKYVLEQEEEKVRGRVMLCLPRRIKRDGVSMQRTSTSDPGQPRPGRGGTAALQGRQEQIPQRGN